MSWGVPYKGSKSCMAQWVVDRLPGGDRLVDIFAGGCAVTHCAMVSERWPKFLANDIDSGPQLFRDAALGKYHDDRRWFSREDFYALKETDPYIKWCWSFGNDGKSYMYSRDIEPYKKAMSDVIAGRNQRERYLAYKQAIKMLLAAPDMINNHADRLQNLERLERLERLGRLERLEVVRGDYRACSLRAGDVVYCDIPYRGTGADYCKGFDYDAFYSWAEAQTVPIIISEYDMPAGRFVCIAERFRRGHLCATNNSRALTERLFVPAAQLAEYRRRMNHDRLEAQTDEP